jgi:hypothetical protein
LREGSTAPAPTEPERGADRDEEAPGVAKKTSSVRASGVAAALVFVEAVVIEVSASDGAVTRPNATPKSTAMMTAAGMVIVFFISGVLVKR